MDFPKSVPGVGLVGGEFVNEDPVLGQQGSLIPAEWGNAVTKELVAVIEEDGQTPSESVLTQLRDALYGAVSSTKRRLLRIASSADMQDNDCDDAAVTPKKLRAGFSFSFTSNGFFAFPTWMGGLVIQWGFGSVPAGSASVVVNWPIAFPGGQILSVVFSDTGSAALSYGASVFTATQATVYKPSSFVGVGGFRFLAIGR